MRLKFIPVRMEVPLSLSVQGDVLTINGEPFDFGPLPDGAILPRSAVHSTWLSSEVKRVDGVIELTLILPHGAHAPLETRFPVPMDVTDGAVILPPFDGEPT